MVNGSASGRAGRNRPLPSQCAYHRASIAAGSKVLGSRVSLMAGGHARGPGWAQERHILPRLVPAAVFAHESARSRALADFTCEAGADGGVRLAFTGPMRVSSLGLIDRRLRTLDQPVPEVGLGHGDEVDTVGAWTAWRVARDHEAKIVNARDEAQRLIDAVKGSEGTVS